MNKFSKFAVVGLLCFSPAIFAQSAFKGFYGQIATGYESNSVGNLNQNEVINGESGGVPYTDSLSYSASTQTFGGVPLVLGLGYNFSVSPKWLLGIGVDYSAMSQTSSSFSQTVTGAFSDGTPFNGRNGQVILGNSIKTSNRVNIFVAPGYEIDKDKLIYVKAGYSMVNVKSEGGTAGQEPDGNTFVQPSLSATKNVSGFIVGLGYKQIISGGLYGFAEGNYMSYGKVNLSTTSTYNGTNVTDTINPNLNSYQLLVGIGYRF